MKRKLATIQKIDKLIPIENADNIELAKIKGWQCIVKKGEFKEGDFCVYFEIDSFLSIHPVFEFLRKSSYKKLPDGTEGFRLRTIKLRGVLSQGLALPISILQEFDYFKDRMWGFSYGDIGMDLTKQLGIKKYEPPIPTQLAGRVKGTFPAFIPKTDEERIQNIPWVLERYQNEIFYVTEKIDGTSVTFYFNNNKFGVCSRNLELKEDDKNLYWQIARKYKIEEKLSQLNQNIAIQGEIIGPGIQKNKYKLNEHKLYIFSGYDIDNQKYLDFNELRKIAGLFSLDIVPIIETNFKLPNTIEKLLEYSNFNSVLNPNIPREGIVIRSIREIKDYKLKRLSFKAINNEFLLKFKE